MTTATASPTEFAPGLAIQGFTAPLSLSQFKLIAFDMDSTIISIECIDEIADAVGRKAEVALNGINLGGPHQEIADRSEQCLPANQGKPVNPASSMVWMSLSIEL